MGDLQKFGSHAGSMVQVVLIAATPVPAGDEVRVTDFGATAGPASTGTVVELQKSNDNFAVNIVPLARIELPNPATALKTYEQPIKIPGGSSFRVIASQTAAGPMSAELTGETDGADITD